MVMAAKTAAAVAEPDKGDVVPQKFGAELPYTIEIGIRGVTPFLFNRMDIESYDIEEGPAGKKKPRTRPEYEPMGWRTPDDERGLPVADLVGSVCAAGHAYQRPTGGEG